MAVVSLLAVVARVTGKLEITANSEARRLPDCGPGRDEGVDAVILGGGKDGGLAARTGPKPKKKSLQLTKLQQTDINLVLYLTCKDC